MKKVLVVGAALMLAGSMVSAASAGNPGNAPDETTGVSISGDARVTYVGMTDYTRDSSDDTANGYEDYFESRVGLNFDAKATGGSFVKARLYFDDNEYYDDAKWDGYHSMNVTMDYAYLGVPLTDNLSVVAGQMPANFSKFFAWDLRVDRLKLVYKSGGLKLVPFVQVADEFTDNALDELDDNDKMAYGLILVSKLNEAWTLKGIGVYFDDAREWQSVTTTQENEDGSTVDVTSLAQRGDHSGFIGSLFLKGAVNNVGLEGEISYKAADVLGKEDDGLGGYVQAAFSMPGFTPVVVAGMTQNGLMAHKKFGFVMVGGDESTTVVNVGNSDGDLMFGALVLMHDISDRFNVQGNLLYASYDYDDEAGKIDSAIEVSGVMSYALSESTSLEYKLGYLAPTYNDGAAEVMEDAYIGQLARLNVEF